MDTGFIAFSRGSFIIDLVVIILVLAMPLLFYSIYIVKIKKNYLLHKRLQIGLSALLAIVIGAFEYDVRFNGWRHLAEVSPYYSTYLFPLLILHLFFAITTVAIWMLTIYRAMKFFANPPRTNSYSAQHKLLGWLATIDFLLTAATGWLFYYVAFVA